MRKYDLPKGGLDTGVGLLTQFGDMEEEDKDIEIHSKRERERERQREINGYQERQLERNAERNRDKYR